MNINELNKKLSGVLKSEQILIDEKMSSHTTFKIGGMADIMLEIDNEEELKSVLEIVQGEFFLLGNGSNLLVSDKGIRGVVIHLSRKYNGITVDGNTLTCKAGATLASIARVALEHALTGIEFAAGIPGSLGGAIVMNAGAYGGEMADVVRSVRLMDYRGNVVIRTGDEMHFGYRHSLLKDEKLIVLETTIELETGDKSLIKGKMEELSFRRRDKQPLDYPSAGSTFKRPQGYFAAKLIEDAGLRGYRIGDAQISPKHCGFIVNVGNATSDDVYSLINYAAKKVWESSDVVIEPEVILVGEFDQGLVRKKAIR